MDIINPATEEKIGEAPNATVEDVDIAVQAARAGWIKRYNRLLSLSFFSCLYPNFLFYLAIMSIHIRIVLKGYLKLA